MTDKQIKIFYMLGILFGIVIPITMLIVVCTILLEDTNLYSVILNVLFIPCILAFICSIIWLILFFIKLIVDKTITFKEYIIPIILTSLSCVGFPLSMFFMFVSIWLI